MVFDVRVERFEVNRKRDPSLARAVGHDVALVYVYALVAFHARVSEVLVLGVQRVIDSEVLAAGSQIARHVNVAAEVSRVAGRAYAPNSEGRATVARGPFQPVAL